MKSTMKLKRLQYADKVSGTLKGSMFFLRSTQNLQKVFLSALALHTRLRISITLECFQFFTRIENSITFTLIHKSRNLIGTGGIGKFGSR